VLSAAYLQHQHDLTLLKYNPTAVFFFGSKESMALKIGIVNHFYVLKIGSFLLCSKIPDVTMIKIPLKKSITMKK